MRLHPLLVDQSLPHATLSFVFLGATSLPAYEAFNYFECAAWFIIAIVLPFWFRAGPPGKRAVILRASLTLLAFGVSDYLEAPTHGRLPWWLWAWKLLCGAYLLKCRADYVGHFRWRDRTNILALICFSVVVLAMFLQHYRPAGLPEFE